MTAQQIFTIVRNHLLAQSECSTKNNVCAYRGENGLKCAVGIIIPDDEYKDGFDEGYMTLSEVVSQVPSLDAKHLSLFADLQHIHDSRSPKKWESELRVLAIQENLLWE